MGKKLTEADKWKNQRWFRLLPPYYKLALEYIHGVCEIDGTWPINILDLVDDLGIPDGFDFEDFVKSCNKDYDNKTGKVIERHRVIVIGEEFLWLTGYIKLQQEGNEFKTINHKSIFARTALMKLAAKGVLGEGLRRGFLPLTIPLQALPIGVAAPSQGALYILIDKEKDKEIMAVLDNIIADDKKAAKKALLAGVPPVGEPAGRHNREPAPDMTEVEFTAFEDQIVEDRKFVEPLMASMYIKSETDLRLWIKSFNVHIVGDSNINKDFKEYKKHFKNWIKKQDTASPPKALNGKVNRAGSTAVIPRATPDDVKAYQKQH